MSTKAWILFVAIVLIGMAGAYWFERGIQPSPAPAAATGTPAAGIANPASVNCVTLGGSLEIVSEENGAVGYCHMKDGRACEEWALFRDGSCTIPQQ